MRGERAHQGAQPQAIDDDVVVHEGDYGAGALAHGAVAGDVETRDGLVHAPPTGGGGGATGGVVGRVVVDDEQVDVRLVAGRVGGRVN